ncbi:MAG: hypothetical protein HIU93_00250 [Acidobacteria bacterium]|nr:hypothetical protein [Acidobacteriota bacterium]MBW4044272.1 hypothetical protein [Acidobacteriota bacterium]
MRLDDELDRQIEAALTTYAEPAEGIDEQLLAQRTLAFLRASAKPHRRWRWMALAAPAFACMLLLAALLAHRPAKPIPPPATMALAPVLPAKPVETATAPQNRPQEGRLQRVSLRAVPLRRAERLPRLQQFPTATPPTQQELLLAAFVKIAPRSTVLAIAEAQHQPIRPIEISGLKISPLYPESLNQ